MSNIENSTAENAEQKDVAAEQERLKQEQERLKEESIEKEIDGKTQEELIEEQEKIAERIKELEEEKERLTKNIESFLSKVVLIIESGINPKEQKQQIKAEGLFDLLPKSVLNLIEENFDKFNFIDYKIAEVLLEEDLIGKEIEALKGKQDLIDEKIETGNEEDEVNEELNADDIENDLKKELELGGGDTDNLEGGSINDKDLNIDDLKNAA
jgi:hypothetical protein